MLPPLYDRLHDLTKGEVRWEEVDSPEDATRLIRRISARSRYPFFLKGKVFTCNTFTAIGSTLGQIQYLVRIERKE